MASKSALMDSARMEILHYEFAGARVDRIAKVAKVNKRMLYHYFGSKDGMCLAVLQRQLALLSSDSAPVPTVLQTVCSIYLSELGAEFLHSVINQVGEGRVSSEDFKIAAILCARAILSLEASSSSANSKTLKYLRSMNPREQTTLCSALMLLIFYGGFQSRQERIDMPSNDVGSTLDIKQNIVETFQEKIGKY